MGRRLPPLNSLKCFEAAGRLLSFTGAARELNVTQAAISHQIKVIEEYLGVSLFERYPRRLALTEQGKALLPEVIEAFDRVSAAIGMLSKDHYSNIISVRLAPSFAAKWLSPRLKYFWLQYPEIDLCLFHAHAAVDFEREEIDIAVTYGKGAWSGVVADKLLSLDFFPVCSPAFLRNDKPLTSIDNLHYYTLLHDANYECWRDWLKLAGLNDIQADKGTIIDDTNVLIQAALDGQGIALGSTTFVEDHLESGRLVRPFDVILENEFSYYVVCPESHLKNPAVLAFKEWLLSLVD
ncbi:MAG: transcriptional regulator GcvA [Gammaproteobacteria bacterium]|jgi:LysR family glycine cleavage system transcriptional activator|nr:transcriptional regulator GcvA [Gammaproteobacteria bacterium]